MASRQSNATVFQAFAEGLEARSGNVRSARAGNGATVLFSYATPVALRDGSAVVVDDRRYSVTTSKQVSGTILPCHLAGLSWDRVPHETFRAMCRAAGVDLSNAR
jgi:hypothetical protein